MEDVLTIDGPVFQKAKKLRRPKSDRCTVTYSVPTALHKFMRFLSSANYISASDVAAYGAAAFIVNGMGAPLKRYEKEFPQEAAGLRKELERLMRTVRVFNEEEEQQKGA